MTKNVFGKLIDEEEQDIRNNWKKETEKRRLPARIAELEREIQTLKEENANLKHYLKDIL